VLLQVLHQPNQVLNIVRRISIRLGLDQGQNTLNA